MWAGADRAMGVAERPFATHVGPSSGRIFADDIVDYFKRKIRSSLDLPLISL